RGRGGRSRARPRIAAGVRALARTAHQLQTPITPPDRYCLEVVSAAFAVFDLRVVFFFAVPVPLAMLALPELGEAELLIDMLSLPVLAPLVTGPVGGLSFGPNPMFIATRSA